MKLIIEGNTYNIPLQTYYVESDSEISQIPSDAPAGTIVEVNESGNFHVKMKMSSGEWNTL